jgi:predicted dienelactone hydrolase
MLLAVLSVPAAMAANLSAPDGPYRVGIGHFELTDPARKGVLTGDTSEPRVIPVVTWYPAVATRARGRPYFDAQEARDEGGSLERIMQYRPGELASLARLRLPSTRDAPPLPGHFPVVIFSHGFFLYPAQNTVLAERLASHGYIVMSIGHQHDAVDLRLANGWLMPTLLPPGDNPTLENILSTIAGDGSFDVRADALTNYPKALMGDRLGTSLVAWIEDTRFVAAMISHGQLPTEAARLLIGRDGTRLALAGMSFGGTTSAATCRLIEACVAAVNLDGENFDPALFDHPVGRPLLMIHSDWTRYPLWPNQSRDPAFNPNDLAYERWSKAGTAPDIIRLRLIGSKHMAFTDLPLVLSGPQAVERFGTIDPHKASAAIGDMVLAFLDVYAKGASRDRITQALRAHPELVRHDVSPVAAWARRTRRDIALPCVVPCH